MHYYIVLSFFHFAFSLMLECLCLITRCPFLRSTVFQKVCYYLCLPACVLKQVVNVIQLVSAAEAIAAQDAAGRDKLL
jgi:hypothetical protein